MKDVRFVKTFVWLNGAVPAVLLGLDALRGGQLGANPVNFAIRTTGLLSLIFLTLSLLVTPVARLTPWKWLSNTRRVFGLYGFYHAALHFLIFFVKDRELSVGGTLSEMVKRPYLIVGSIGLIVMVPLAVTSTNGMIKRLGPRRWKALHRLAYVAAIAGVVHYSMQTKADVTKQFAIAVWAAVRALVTSPVTQPMFFAGAVAVLLLYRIVAHYVTLRSSYRKLLALPAVAPATQSRPKFWKGKLRVVRIFDETPSVRTFRLAAPDGGRLPFDYMPGQYLNLSLTIDGKRVNRSYTIASSPTRAGGCELTVKREDGGLGSRHLHDAVHEGDLLDVGAPAGRFTFDEKAADSIVLIAGGVGITPLMSKVRCLLDLSWPGQIYLIVSARTRADIIFRDELAQLQRRHTSLHVTITLTRDDAPDWTGERGRLTTDLLSRAVPDIKLRPVHICGPTEMTEPTRQMLLDLGVPDDRISTESFTSPSRATSDGTTASTVAAPPAEPSADAMLTFARSGKTVAASDGKTVLELAEDQGVTIDFDCRSGICGRCKVKLVDGEVKMDSQDALTTADVAAGLILSCQAHCVEQVTVDA